MPTSQPTLQTPAISDSLSPRHILILEDDAAFGAALTAFLTAKGYGVTHVRNGLDAMPHVLNPDLVAVVCDLILPVMPGDLFYAAVERLRPQLCERFIFMSGFTGLERVRTFMKRKRVASISKPFLLDDLMAKIEPLVASLAA